MYVRLYKPRHAVQYYLGKKEWNFSIFNKMERSWGYYAKWKKLQQKTNSI